VEHNFPEDKKKNKKIHKENITNKVRKTISMGKLKTQENKNAALK